MGKNWFKELMFYSIAASIIAAVAQLAGASISLVLFLSLLVPPLILIVIRIIR